MFKNSLLLIFIVLNLGSISAQILQGGHYFDAQNEYSYGNYDLAIQYYHKALLAQNNDFPEIYNHLGLCYRDKGYHSQAMQCFTKAINLNPFYYDALFNMAYSCSKKGKTDMSIYYYKKAIEVYPNSMVYYNLGAVYFNIGNSSEGKKYFVQSAKLGGKEAQQWLHSKGYTY